MQTENSIRVLQALDTSNSSHPFVKVVGNHCGCFRFTADIDRKTAPFAYAESKNSEQVLPSGILTDIGFSIGTLSLGTKKEDLFVSFDILKTVHIDPALRTLLEIETFIESDQTMYHIISKKTVVCRGWLKQKNIKDRSTDSFVKIAEIMVGIKVKPHKLLITTDRLMFEKSLNFMCQRSVSLIKGGIFNRNEVFLDIEVPDEIQKSSLELSFHPSLFDCLFQSSVVSILCNFESKQISDEERKGLVPVAADGIQMFRPFEKKMHIYTKITNRTVLETVIQYHCSSMLIDSFGNKIAVIQNVTSCYKRIEDRTPFELGYSQVWIPFKHLQPHRNQPRTLLIHQGFSNNEMQDLKWNEAVTLFKCSAKETNAEELITKCTCFLQDIDCIVFMVKGRTTGMDLTESTADNLYKTATATFKIVVEIIRYLSQKGSTTPMYIVTEKTQFNTNNEVLSETNFVGSELWGLVRSAHTDFILGTLTCVDLQPSVEETKDKLMEFVCSTYSDIEDIGTDFAIDKEGVYCLELRSIPKFREIQD